MPGATASLASFDARTARRALEAVRSHGSGRPRAVLRRPRTAALAIPWRDAAAALRAPGRVVEGAALAGAGTALAVLSADQPVTLAAAMLVVYLGAARTLSPLRAELDAPARARVMLRPRSGRVLLAHTLVPTVVTTSGATLAVAACAVSGALPARDWATALLAVAVTPALTFCAAMSARRGGRLPPSVLGTAVAADPSGGGAFLSLWLLFWPALATALAGVPLLLTASAGAGAAVAAAAGTGVATAALVHALGRDPVEA